MPYPDTGDGSGEASRCQLNQPAGPLPDMEAILICLCLFITMKGMEVLIDMYMYIKKAENKDQEDLARVAAACFPPEEAESKERIEGRLAVYPNCFWLGRSEFHELIAFAAGPVTKEKDLADWMYADPSVHDPEGDWQMIFSLCTMPDCRRQGLGGLLLRRVIEEADDAGRKGVVLTCKEEKIPFYEKFGFVNEGVSQSVHGGARWYQMRLTFDEDYRLDHIIHVSDNPDENNKAIEDFLWSSLF